MTATPNKTDAGNGSKAVCRVSHVHPSPSPTDIVAVESDDQWLFQMLINEVDELVAALRRLGEDSRLGSAE